MPGSPKRARPAPTPAPKRAGETQAILERLYGQHPNATTELDFTTPFELLVATILSAQSSDARVNQVTPAFFKRYPDPQRLAAATTAELEPQIVATGLLPAEVQDAARHGAGPARAPRRPGAGRHGRVDGAARRRPQDGERRARPRARRARPAGRSPCAARRQPHRHRPGGDTRGGRDAAVRGAAARAMDAGVLDADPARPPRLPADAAAVPRVRRRRPVCLRRRDAHRRAAPTPAAAGAAQPGHRTPSRRPEGRSRVGQPGPSPGATRRRKPTGRR